MGNTFRPLPVKLIVGLISEDTALFQRAETILIGKFGEIDTTSAIFAFDKTDYYEKEMGKDLKRKFLCFKGLLLPERLVKIKLFSNSLEKKLSKKRPSRSINIDPGYISLSKLVLATTKSFAHRIYAGCGIYEEITLYFKGQTFQPGAWTYPDYKSPSHIAFFNNVREIYHRQIEKKYGLSQLSRCV